MHFKYQARLNLSGHHLIKKIATDLPLQKKDINTALLPMLLIGTLLNRNIPLNSQHFWYCQSPGLNQETDIPLSVRFLTDLSSEEVFSSFNQHLDGFVVNFIFHFYIKVIIR